MASRSRRMASRVTTRPVCWSKSWRLTPWMQHALAVDEQVQCRGPRTLRKPTLAWARSTTEPSAASSDTSSPYSRGHLRRPGLHARHAGLQARRARAGRLEMRVAARASEPRPRPCPGPVELVTADERAAGRVRRPVGQLEAGQRRVQHLVEALQPGLDAPARLWVGRAGRRPGPRRPGVPGASAVLGQPGRHGHVSRGTRAAWRTRKTERVRPPCHHWSWSSMKVASDHFTTVSRSTFRPATT